MNRRQLLQLSSFAGMGLLLDSCGGLNQYSTAVGNAIEPLNQRVEELGSSVLSMLIYGSNH